MTWFESLVLGVVQGLTEFLPISSSAHLRITAAIAGWEDPGAAFTAVIQIGTELAIVLYFRKDIVAIVTTWARSLRDPALRADPNARMGWLIIVGSVPIVLLGLLLQDQIKTVFRDLHLVAATLIGFGIVLGIADRVARNERTLEQLTARHGVLYGLAQALALIPGVSRSGGTISAGLLLGYRREAAARYAFLLALPAVFGSGLYELKDIGGADSPEWGPTALATVVSFLVGYAVIAWLMRWITTRSFMPFVVYRVALGLLLLVLIALGAVDPNAAAGI